MRLLVLSVLISSLLVLGNNDYEVKTPPLTTNWTYTVGTNPWPEHPRPQLARSAWKSLNGVWRYENAYKHDALSNPPFGKYLKHAVLIPSCLESGLSGIQANGTDVQYSWFATKFSVPAEWQERVLLAFGKVDYEATVFINGHRAGFHRGGYFRFSVDATDYLKKGQENELLVFVNDPTDSGDNVIPQGKQTLRPSHIFYRSCSGIWGQVMIESVPQNWVTQLDLSANMNGQVTALVHSAKSEPCAVTISVHGQNGNDYIATHNASSDQQFTFNVPSPKLWSPTSPSLYNITVTLGNDRVQSYIGFRTISSGRVNGIQRPLLNGHFTFLFSPLDQGYWPDGLYVPPTYEAMVYDLKVLKRLGFNAVRKHMKVEFDLFYFACDTMGLAVIQDMPSMRPLQTMTYDNCTTVDILPNTEQRQEFDRQLAVLVTQLKSFPSIVAWVIFNEGWTQGPGVPEADLTQLVRKLDPTRLIDATSGWNDHGYGDFSDNHHYSNPQCGAPVYSTPSSPYDPSRIGFQGEFGGIGNNVSIEHLWNVQQAIDTINQTYEVDTTIEAWNSRGHILLSELQGQIEQYACSGAVWTETTDVEGEVNGLLTYDRRILRTNVSQWQADIAALYAAAESRA